MSKIIIFSFLKILSINFEISDEYSVIPRLFDKIAQEKADKEGEERRSKIGTGDRSEKVRTYNYPQNRVTDHRIGFSILQLDRVMEGKLEPILDALIGEDLKRKLEGKEQ